MNPTITGIDVNKLNALVAENQKKTPTVGGAVANGMVTQDGNTPINVNAFNTRPYTVPPPVNDTTAQTKLGVTASQATIPAPEKTTTQTTADRIAEIAGIQATQGDFTTQAQTDVALADKTQMVADLSAKAINAKKSWEDKIKKVKENTGGMLAGQLANAVQDLELKANEDLANIGIQQQVALGNLSAAQQIIKDKVEAKFEPLKNELATRVQQFNILQNDMTESQKMEFQRNTAIEQAELKYQQDLELSREEKTIDNGQKYTPKQLSIISKINQDVSKNATYTKTSNMRSFADNVSASLGLGTGAGDLAAINQFQKVIDEGAVTRDQDVKLIQSSQSLLNKLTTKVKGLTTGEQLSSDIRQEMLQAVNALYEAQLKALSKDPYIKAKNTEATLYGLSAMDTILGELQTITGTVEVSPEKENIFDEVISIQVTPATTTPATTRTFTIDSQFGENKSPFKF